MCACSRCISKAELPFQDHQDDGSTPFISSYSVATPTRNAGVRRRPQTHPGKGKGQGKGKGRMPTIEKPEPAQFKNQGVYPPTRNIPVPMGATNVTLEAVRPTGGNEWPVLAGETCQVDLAIRVDPTETYEHFMGFGARGGAVASLVSSISRALPPGHPRFVQVTITCHDFIFMDINVVFDDE